MPIANCILSPDCAPPSRAPDDIVHLWAQHSGITHAEPDMTVNILHSQAQAGNRYAIMATLLLPSTWSDEDVTSLQLGLASALAAFYALPVEQVFISTTIVASGRVVENGNTVCW